MPDEDLLIRPASPAAAAPAAIGAARALPANIEAETAFIGAVLIDNRLMEELATPLRPEHFFEPVHQRIFERILTLLDRNAVVTPVTLKPYFEADEALRELGGVAYLARLTADGQGLLAPRELATQIYDLALLRELVTAPVKLVHASRDKKTRATPIAALYERGLVHHVGCMPELEDQMCQFDGTGKSPDRMDALVWALTELFPLERRAEPRIRSLGD